MKIPRYILRGFAGIFTILSAVFGMMNDPDDKKWALRFALIAISAWTVEMFLVLRHQHLKNQADLSVAPKGKLKSEIQPQAPSLPLSKPPAVRNKKKTEKTTESFPAKKDASPPPPVTPSDLSNPLLPLLPYSVRKRLVEFVKAGEPQYTAQELVEIRIANGDRVIMPERRDKLSAALTGFKGPLSVYVDDNDSEAVAFCEELVAILKATEEKRIKISRSLINTPPQYGIILELKSEDTVPPHAKMLYEALTNAGFSIEMVFKPYLSEYEAPRLVIGYGPRRQEAEQEAERIRDIRIKRLGPSRS